MHAFNCLDKQSHTDGGLSTCGHELQEDSHQGITLYLPLPGGLLTLSLFPQTNKTSCTMEVSVDDFASNFTKKIEAITRKCLSECHMCLSYRPSPPVTISVPPSTTPPVHKHTSFTYSRHSPSSPLSYINIFFLSTRPSPQMYK